MRGEKHIEVPNERRNREAGEIKIKGGQVFNIKNMDVKMPLGRFNVITGVSGSGKSSFMYEILHRNLMARLERKQRSSKVFNCDSFTGSEYLSRVVLIDQSLLGVLLDLIQLHIPVPGHIYVTCSPRVRRRDCVGWKASRFSFNVKGGRCEACQGNGEIAVEMHFLPTVYVTCDVCSGKRFMKETLK